MKRIILIILAVVAVFLLIGFSFQRMAVLRGQRGLDLFSTGTGFGGSGGGAPEVLVAPPMEEAPAAAPEFDAAGDIAKSSESFDSARQAVQQERMVIQTADLAIVVRDPQGKMSEIGRLASELGGYVVSSNLYQSYTNLGKEVPEASIVIRVPAEKLDEALAEIKQDAVDVQYENRSGQDVTNEYVNLQSQLRAKEAAEEQLLEIMEDAVKAEDVLAVYMQVQAIQTEIEQLKGQIKYYDEVAALSAVSVRLIAEESTQPIEVGPWKPAGAAKEALEDLIYFVQNFVDFLIRFVIYVLPALILIAIPLLLVFFAGRAIYRRSRKSKASVEEKDIEKK